jgi:predicted ATP-dependent endonuclease of OLD family
MKLEKFKIKNYKSITDSGFCWLASDITILAGKNESGKSGILEAIRDFSRTIPKIPESAKPISKSDDTRIELFFSLNENERKKISKKLQLPDIEIEKLLKPHIGISKDENGRYEFTEEIDDPYIEYVDSSNSHAIDQINDAFDKIKKFYPENNILFPSFKDNINQYSKDLSSFLGTFERMQPFINSNEKTKIQVQNNLGQIKKHQKELKNYDQYFKVVNELVAEMPNIIFFSDFTDILPNSITFQEAQSNSTIKNFATISALDLSKALDNNLDPHRRMNLLSHCSAKITGDFKDHWAQDKLNIIVTSDGQKLLFSVEEQGRHDRYKPEQRSKGFQWFLSFYLRLTAERGKTNIILIDEPGLYVHAKAQKDILGVLESLANEMQIIFSTHSPYLIDNRRLDRIRLVKKGKTGTIIESKIHKNADKETLTPVVTAIGLDLCNQFSVVGVDNIILEGFSDYYFLSGMKKKLGEKKFDKKYFVPCVGATKIPIMISLIMGWGLNFVALLDNDPEGIRVEKDLKEKYHIDPHKVLFVSEKSKTRIEDLFSKDDFHKYITNDSSKTVTASNSDYLTQNKLDKVLLSKFFFERINNGVKTDLSKETISNFTELFEKIESAFLSS